MGRERLDFGSNKVARHEWEAGRGAEYPGAGGGLEPLTPQAAFGNSGFVF